MTIGNGNVALFISNCGWEVVDNLILTWGIPCNGRYLNNRIPRKFILYFGEYCAKFLGLWIHNNDCG